MSKTIYKTLAAFFLLLFVSIQGVSPLANIFNPFGIYLILDIIDFKFIIDQYYLKGYNLPGGQLPNHHRLLLS